MGAVDHTQHFANHNRGCDRAYKRSPDSAASELGKTTLT